MTLIFFLFTQMENAAHQCANFGALTDEELNNMFEHDLLVPNS